MVTIRRRKSAWWRLKPREVLFRVGAGTLAGADLTGAALSRADLGRADLRKTILVGIRAVNKYTRAVTRWGRLGNCTRDDAQPEH